ncbi:MAG: sigma 54-interacting transcriptional regulator [Desulfobacterales bacterium]|nr:sigma 54-interacting transcriptional regulator [Desulfobacterales bacterium]
MDYSEFQKIISANKNFERVLNNLRDGIIAHDLTRKILYFNRAAENITGFKKEEVLNKDCHETIGSLCVGYCSFCENKNISEDIFEYTANYTNKMGETRKLEIYVTMIKDENNKIVGALSCFKDITDILALKQKAEEITAFSNIIGRHSEMIKIYENIKDVAKYDYPVHIFGETGTGKELVANAIHNESSRAGKPFIAINCSAMPETLIESELFGYVKGAFSGAIKNKKGKFELADKGTIFLDEIAELSPSIQVKLLRFIQEGTIEKLGDEKTTLINARIICATNKDLKEEVKKGTFREDLYYRLNVIPIKLPQLRERKTDIPLLSEYFLKRFNYSKKRFSHKVLSLFIDYPWPGNVRELQNAVQFAIVKSKGSIIQSNDIPNEILNYKSPKKQHALKLNLNAVKTAIKQAGGNKAKAARFLGVGRATLYRFLDIHKL